MILLLELRLKLLMLLLLLVGVASGLVLLWCGLHGAIAAATTTGVVSWRWWW